MQSILQGSLSGHHYSQNFDDNNLLCAVTVITCNVTDLSYIKL